MNKLSILNSKLARNLAFVVTTTLGAYAVNCKATNLSDLTSTSPSEVAQTIQSLGLVGGNLGGLDDWDSTHPFVDLMKQARQLGSANTPWDGLAVLGNDGWPVGDFGVILMIGQSAVTGISGVYKFSFTGQATVVNTLVANSRIQNVSYNSALNITQGEINFPPGEDQLFLTFRNTNGGIKNLKVIHPGYSLDNTPVFRTEFLSHIKRAQMLRFMDWMHTNNNTTTSWTGRANPASTHDSRLGAAWEDVIELANETNKAIWINIPAQADDDYVLNLAKLINKSINPGIPVYIEYSNELWNFGFQQSGYNVQTAQAEVIANPGSPLNYNGDSNYYGYGFRRIAYRLKQISDIFRSVVGDTKMMSIYRPVLAGQIVNPTILQSGLGMIQAVFGAPKQYFYALAGAPYFNLGSAQTQTGLSTTMVLNALDQSASTTSITNRYESNGALAAWYGLKFLAYEAGSDTFGSGSLDAKEAANKDPRMQTICENYLNIWYQAGLDTVNWFTFGAGSWSTQYGTWPITYDINVNTPKTNCLDATNAKTLPKVSTRHMVPGSWDARERPDYFAPYDAPFLRWVHQPSYTEFMFYVTTAGSYSLILKGGADSSSNGSNTVKIALNNKTIAPSFAMTVTTNSTLLQQTPIRLQLKKGINVLHFSSAQPVDSWFLSQITIK